MYSLYRLILTDNSYFYLFQPYFQIVFTDPKNKAIFTNADYGRTIQRHMVSFTPSEVSFYEHDSRTFLVLDKTDRTVSVYFTTTTTTKSTLNRIEPF